MENGVDQWANKNTSIWVDILFITFFLNDIQMFA